MKLTLDEILKRFECKHGDRYDYSKVEYVNIDTNVTIICPEHGEFEQTPYNHIKYVSACPLCSGRVLTRDDIITRFRAKHYDKFDYSKVDFKGTEKPVTIICPEHGEFQQTPHQHVQSDYGCKGCSNWRRGISTDTIIERAIVIHGDKYDYSKVDYVGSCKPITVICPEHGEFTPVPDNHNHPTKPTGCPSCGRLGNSSKGENEVLAYCNHLGLKTIQCDRTIIAPLEIDIVVLDDDDNPIFGIEFNGEYWHSEGKKPIQYHKDKYLKAKAAGLPLFQVWGRLWVDPIKQSIIKSMIRYKAGQVNRIPGRKCERVEVDFRAAREFYNNNHIQSAGIIYSTQSHYALIHNGEIVMCMSYKANYLIRLCTVLNTVVQGGASKLINKLPSGEWYTYINNDLGGRGEHYLSSAITITRTSLTKPSYLWSDGNIHITRQSVQKHKLSKLYPEYDGSTEIEWMRKLGFNRVFNSGNTRVEFLK